MTLGALYSNAQNVWQYENQEHPKGAISGKFINQGNKKWTEQNTIEGPFTFEEVSNLGSELILFDKNRKVYVKITPTEMSASWGNANNWQKYYDGRWLAWTYESQSHAKGDISGKFSYLGNNKWIEENTIEGPYHFETISNSLSETILFDKQRNVYVKLTADEMWASWGNQDSWEKYYEGAWK